MLKNLYLPRYSHLQFEPELEIDNDSCLTFLFSGGTNPSRRYDNVTEAILQVDLDQKLRRVTQRQQRFCQHFCQHSHGVEEMLQPCFSYQTARERTAPWIK